MNLCSQLLGACGELFSSGFKHPFEVGILRFAQMSGGTSLPLSASAADHSMLAATHTYPLAFFRPIKRGRRSSANREGSAKRESLSVVAVVFVFFVLKAFTIF
jgi:hypothetical protein